MAALLDDNEVRTALESLPGWSRDGDVLQRVVPVADDQHDTVERAVAKVSDEVNHHADIEKGEGNMTFRLSTHSAGGITGKDVDLAARIDQLLSGATQD